MRCMTGEDIEEMVKKAIMDCVLAERERCIAALAWRDNPVLVRPDNQQYPRLSETWLRWALNR